MINTWKPRHRRSFVMRFGVGSPQLPRIALAVVLVSLVVIPAPSAQTLPTPAVDDKAAQHQANLQAIAQNKAGYAASIVARWEADARASGKWDPNYASDLFNT